MDGDQKFVRSMMLLSMAFAAFVTLGAVAAGYLLERNGEPERN